MRLPVEFRDRLKAMDLWARRILPRVMPEPNTGCWLWPGAHDKKGYGKLKQTTTHRIAYLAEIGDVPAGMTIDHLCKATWCCNPEHLRVLSRSENTSIARPGQHNRDKVKCPSGHPYDDRNTFINNRGERICRECNRANSRAFYLRRKEASRVKR